MKKKLMMLAGTLMLAVLLAACGSGETHAEPTPTTVPTATTVPTPTTVPTATIAPTATSTPTPEPTATPTPEPTATSTPTPEPTATSTPTPIPALADTYEKGIITEAGYESKWMDLRFTAQPDMYMLTQEELDASMKQSLELMYGEAVDTVLDYTTLTTVTEMMAQTADGASAVISVERLPVLYVAMTEEEYLQAVLSNLANSAAQPKVTTGENYYEVELGGEIYLGISVSSDYNTGVIVYQEFLVRKQANRMISVVVSYADYCVENAQRLLESFGTYDSEPVILPEVTTAPEEAPTEAPAAAEGVFQAGVITEAGYENEWLNLRITLPDGVTRTEESEQNSLVLEMAWASGVPVVQFIVEKSQGETPEAHLDIMKDVFTQIGQGQGMTYTFAEELQSLVIGGHEYLDLYMEVNTSAGIKVYQDYCVRIQDGYTVVLVFSYADGFEEELQDAINMFSLY